MDFRIPDQRQYQPHHVPIVASAPFRLSTRVDTPLLHSLLQPAHAVRLSCDAGRFLCNYTLFLSLQLCREKRGGGGGGGGEEDALFVHVPPFERVGQEEQLSFLYDLLHALGTMEEAGVRWVREEGEGGEEGLVTTMGLGMLSDQIDAASYPRTQQGAEGRAQLSQTTGALRRSAVAVNGGGGRKEHRTADVPVVRYFILSAPLMMEEDGAGCGYAASACRIV